MKRWGILFFAIALGLYSCQWGKPNNPKADVTKDTLTYTYKTIKQRASDCGSKPDSDCTVASVKYPFFTAQQILNDTISNRIIMLFGRNNPDIKPDTDLQQYVENFITGYKKDNPKQYSPDMFYTLELKASVVRQDSSITTLQLEGYIYEGGAHGSSITTFVNWNTKIKQNIYLKDILKDNYAAQLTAISDTIFRKQEKLSDTASLAKDYFFKDNKFALNENYSITPLGIKFLYNQYEIKPYAAGQTELFIPYARIKSLLKPNTVITQYLK